MGAISDEKESGYCEVLKMDSWGAMWLGFAILACAGAYLDSFTNDWAFDHVPYGWDCIDIEVY